MADDNTAERVRCQATTQAGRQCQNLAHIGLVFCNRHRDPEARCPALNMYGRQCNWDKLEGQAYCHYHINAREEGWNWWEWEDEEAAQAFREEMLERIQEERGESEGLGTHTVMLRVDPASLEPAVRSTPWWRRWWMGIIWIILAILVIGAIATATSG